ncbi:MAG: GntR family transcriptional regulator [Clostridiales bacterium]|nr:GntR family transcriptional regulator [Clostridiales bacterium]
MEHELKVNMNECLPLRDVVFNTLRQAILRGELEPGERLMEIQLANRLGVSRTPIREAIRKLELDGLVLMIPRKGAEVAKISEQSLRDVLEVRRSLDELAIELTCQRITKEGLEKLERAHQAVIEAVNEGDPMTIAESDEHFHDVIYEGTQNSRLVQILNNLRENIYRFRLEYIKDEDHRHIMIAEHENILRTIRDRHIPEAKIAIREHVENQEVMILRKIQESN